MFAFVGETVGSSCTKERDVLGVIAQIIGQQGLDLLMFQPSDERNFLQSHLLEQLLCKPGAECC